MTSAQEINTRDTGALERGHSQCERDPHTFRKNSMLEFVLYGPDGDPAARIEEGVVQIDWRVVEDLAAYEADPSLRARSIARLLLEARKQSEERSAANA